MSKKIIEWKKRPIRSVPKLRGVSFKRASVSRIKGVRVPKIKTSGLSGAPSLRITNSYGRKLKLR
jgi:hypothetical protein